MIEDVDDDTEDFEKCPFCEGEVAIVETDTTIPYGLGKEPVEIPVTLNVRVCRRCDETWCDKEASKAKDRAIEKYLRENE